MTSERKLEKLRRAAEKLRHDPRKAEQYRAKRKRYLLAQAKDAEKAGRY